MSHPSWVRGLKPGLLRFFRSLTWSHPSWVRGLKLEVLLHDFLLQPVAPLVGAWIETKKAAKTS